MIDPAEHPDADFLAAFSQGDLSARERAILLDHFSRCCRCRECVFSVAEITQAETKKRSLYKFAAWAAAAGMAWFSIGVPQKPVTIRPIFPRDMQITTSNKTARSRYAFRHVSLTSASDSFAARRWTTHLVPISKQQNQIAIQTQNGERWLTFDKTFMLLNREEPAGSVN